MKATTSMTKLLTTKRKLHYLLSVVLLLCCCLSVAVVWAANTRATQSYAVLESDAHLDPAEGKSLLISFYVRFSALPKVGYRQNLVAKYDAGKPPYPGWAIGIHQLKSSLRPEVYWRGKDGSGGWFTFDRYSFVPGKWYALSVYVQENAALSLYVQRILSPFGDEAEAASEENDEWGKAQPVSFLGTYAVNEVSLPSSGAPLLLGNNRTEQKAFRGELSQVLIAYPEKIPHSRKGQRKFFDGGAAAIVERISKQAVTLWVGDSGTDESSFSRKISFTGETSWHSQNSDVTASQSVKQQ